MNPRLSPLALALTGALTLSACGGGGGGSSSSSGSTPAAVDVTVTPALGQFSSGCSVELRKATGELLGSANVGLNGRAIVPVSGYTGAVIAAVKGSTTCTYFDEASGTDKPFDASRQLSAVVDSLRQEFGINILTDLAATRVLDTSRNALASTATTDTIKQENAAVQVMFQVGDMFTPPTLLNRTSGKVVDNTEAGRLAIRLAALAEVATELSLGVSSLATHLADDLKDGQLDSLDTTRLQTGLSAAIGKYASDSAKASLDDAAANTHLTANAASALEQARAVLAAGTSLQQAKQIFADLRSSILSISNNAGTGSLDQQNALLQSDFQHGVDAVQVIDQLALMAWASAALTDPDGAAVSSGDSICMVPHPVTANHIECALIAGRTKREYHATVRPATNGVTWEITHVRNLETGTSTALTGLTGTLTRDTAGRYAASGNFYPMTGDSTRTAVNFSFTYDGSRDAAQVWAGSGSVDALKADNSSALKIIVSDASGDQGVKSTHLVASLIGPHHRFDGSLDIGTPTTALDGATVEPKNGRLVGTFTDISNPAAPFKFLEGTINYSQDLSAFDPRLAPSSNNYIRQALGFTGTAYKSAGVAGIGLTLSATNADGLAAQRGEFSFTGLNGLTLTGKATQSNAGWVWEIKNSNGITVSYSSATRSGTVKNADGTTLGTVSTQRVSFIDGTYESLI
ncbi:hypothetical protein [Zoogloea sp.]|uniref:hypothetical protein n=1 Tax=Zoogloea sp. TaxID=49181 RepID=UPI0035B2EB52